MTTATTDVRPAKLPGPNQPCWCGSGEKYKKCHRDQDAAVLPAAEPPRRPVRLGQVSPRRDVPPEILEPTGRIQWVGPGCHLLAYYIRGTDLVNIVTQEDTDKWVEEGWSTRGDPDEMRRSFPNPEPGLEKLLGLVTECSKWGLFTRPLTERQSAAVICGVRRHPRRGSTEGRLWRVRGVGTG